MSLNYQKGDEPVKGYRLTRLLSRGHGREVWAATRPNRSRVAVRILDLGSTPGYTQFTTLTSLRRLTHPNVLPVMGLWLIGSGQEVLLSESAPGEDGEADDGTLGAPSSSSRLIIAQELGEESLAVWGAHAREVGDIPIDELLTHLAGAARGIDYLNDYIGPGGRKSAPHANIRHERDVTFPVLWVGW